MTPLRGVLVFWDAQGDRGVAFQDARFLKRSQALWPAEGRHMLKSGDALTVFDRKNPACEIWSGTLWFPDGSIFPEGVDRKLWAEWLMGNNPAELTPRA